MTTMAARPSAADELAAEFFSVGDLEVLTAAAAADEATGFKIAVGFGG